MIKNIQMIIMLVIVAAMAFIAYKIFSFFKENGEKFNPISDKNFAYQGVNKIVQAVTGEDDVTLGTKIFDWFNKPVNTWDATQAQKTYAAIAANKAAKNKNINTSPVIFGTSEGE